MQKPSVIYWFNVYVNKKGFLCKKEKSFFYCAKILEKATNYFAFCIEKKNTLGYNTGNRMISRTRALENRQEE